MLQITIDGSWEPEDFIEVLQGIESLYYRASTSATYIYRRPYFGGALGRSGGFDQFLDEANHWLLAEARLLATASQRLRVHRIAYGSPGSLEFFGQTGRIAVVVAAIIWGIEFYDDRHIRAEQLAQAKLETEIAHETLRSRKLDIARKILQLQKDFPDAVEPELLALTVRDLDKIFPRIAEGKIVGASSEDNER